MNHKQLCCEINTSLSNILGFHKIHFDAINKEK